MTNNKPSLDTSHKIDFSEIVKSFCEGKGRKPFFDWDKHIFNLKKPAPFWKIIKQAMMTINKAEKFLNKINSAKLASINRSRSLPKNATIRKEYIKCGKQFCEQKHGPYYYAYWKDPESKKLKKKYIGNHIPKNKELNDYCNNNHIM